jgi:transglutaminase-like putative cysteine protease
MGEIAFGCDLHYEVTAPTTFLFNLVAARTHCQFIVHELLQLSPNVPIEAFELGLSHNRVHRVRLEPCEFHLHYEGVVNLNAEVDVAETLATQPYRELPPDVLPYLNPSRFCESDLLGNFAMSEFGSLRPGYSHVSAICDWTSHHIVYTPGSTDARTTARDVLVQRQGVCRDFAHLAIALCRGLSIPARYVSGYAVDLQPPDFHGFFEAYLGERWYLFDATRLAPVSGLVRIADGHDAADVPFATLMGAANLQAIRVWANPTAGAINARDPSTTDAVSTA